MVVDRMTSVGVNSTRCAMSEVAKIYEKVDGVCQS